jgi:hypothetical protein
MSTRDNSVSSSRNPKTSAQSIEAKYTVNESDIIVRNIGSSALNGGLAIAKNKQNAQNFQNN